MTTSTVIITCCSALVPYYLSKWFIIVEKVYGLFVNITDPIFNQINASLLHDEDRLLACKASIPYIVQNIEQNCEYKICTQLISV